MSSNDPGGHEFTQLDELKNLGERQLVQLVAVVAHFKQLGSQVLQILSLGSPKFPSGQTAKQVVPLRKSATFAQLVQLLPEPEQLEQGAVQLLHVLSLESPYVIIIFLILN